MYFNASGNVGIGTSNPQTELHVHDSAGLSQIRLSGTASDADTFQLGQGTTGVTNGGFTIRDVEASADRLVINSSGNVGIGTNNPGAKLHVEGNIRASGNIGVTQTDGDYLAKLYQTSADGFLELYTGEATPVSRVKLSSYGDSYIAPSTNSGLGIGTTSPGHKLDVDGGSIRVQDVGQYIYFGSNSSVKVGTASGNSNDLYIGSADDINMESNYIRLYRDGYYGSTEYGRLSFSDDSWLCTGSSSHYLGIGTNNPTEKLHVSGNVSATAYYGDGSNLTGVGGSTDANAVGTYAWAYRNVVGGYVSWNSTYAGSDLRATGTGTYPYSRQAYGDNIGTANLSGTWRAMGNGSGANSRFGTTLFVRIS